MVVYVAYDFKERRPFPPKDVSLSRSLDLSGSSHVRGKLKPSNFFTREVNVGNP